MAHQEPASQKPFRVVIVGAGLVGLSLSHSLQLANIDHVVLEKHDEIVSVHGAALTIFPSVARVFDQFGILKKILDSVTPIQKEYLRWPDGSVNMNPKALSELDTLFGFPVVLFDRQKCVRFLYENLPDQSKIRTSTRVERIEHTETGVKVYLKDGTFEEGDLVIGADGVHSRTRELMWDYAAENDPKAIPESDKQALFSQYKAIFGVSDNKGLPDLGPADVNVILGEKMTKLLFTQPGIAYWAVIWRDEYSQPPKPYRADQKEQEELAEKFKDIKMTDNLTFEGLWKNKTRAGALNIEEGILDKWHAGRIVLVGDSAHKMTADIGIGANMAIESAVVLCNVLQRSVASDPNRHFTIPELSKLFTEYQSKRHERASIFMNLSGGVTRMRSYETLWKRFFVSYIATLPWMQRFQNGKMFEGFSKGPKLNYVPTRTIDETAEGWSLGKKKKEESGWVMYALLTSAVGVGLSYAAVLKWGLPL